MNTHVAMVNGAAPPRLRSGPTRRAWIAVAIARFIALTWRFAVGNLRRPANAGGVRWRTVGISSPRIAFERTSKRRRGFPSETHVKRGDRVVHGDKELLLERHGRDDPCPCGSGRRFRRCCLRSGVF